MTENIISLPLEKRLEQLHTIGFSTETSSLLLELKRFNYENIYLAPETKNQAPLIAKCYSALFDHYLATLEKGKDTLSEEIDLMTDIKRPPQRNYSHGEMVRDYIAGMTDNFFIEQARSIGCTVPKKSKSPL